MYARLPLLTGESSGVGAAAAVARRPGRTRESWITGDREKEDEMACTGMLFIPKLARERYALAGMEGFALQRDYTSRTMT